MECNKAGVLNISSNNCVSTSSNAEVGSLIEIRYSLAVGYIALMLLLTVVGVAGNSIVIYLISKDRHMNVHAKYFILNSAIADMCVVGVADPVCIAGAFLGMQHFNRNVWLCSFFASLCLTACACVFLSFTNLTINRWLFICHTNHYHKLYNKLSVSVICVLCWLVSFLVELPNFLGWGGHYFDQKSHQCIWDRTASRSYTMFVAIGLLTSPFVMTGFCNVAILKKIWVAKRAIGVFQVEERNTFIQSVRSSKTLIGMYVTYLACWTPYVIVLILDHSDTFSMETHLFVTLLAHAHSSTSFFIYLAFNSRFKQQLRQLLGRRGGNSVVPSATSLARVTPSTKTAHKQVTSINN